MEREMERVFLYCIAWSLGGILESEDRHKLDNYLRGLSDSMPPFSEEHSTIFDYFINKDSLQWERWSAPHWDTNAFFTQNISFAQLIVPTVDTAR